MVGGRALLVRCRSVSTFRRTDLEAVRNGTRIICAHRCWPTRTRRVPSRRPARAVGCGSLHYFRLTFPCRRRKIKCTCFAPRRAAHARLAPDGNHAEVFVSPTCCQPMLFCQDHHGPQGTLIYPCCRIYPHISHGLSWRDRGSRPAWAGGPSGRSGA